MKTYNCKCCNADLTFHAEPITGLDGVFIAHCPNCRMESTLFKNHAAKLLLDRKLDEIRQMFKS